MEQDYDGTIDNIDLPDPILLEVQTSVLVESNYLCRVQCSAEYESGNKLCLDIDLFEQYLGDEEYSNVPVIKYSTERFAPAHCGQVRLCTPNYFRTFEVGAAGLRDPFEGCRASHQWEAGSELVITSSEDGGTLRFNAAGANIKCTCHKTFIYSTSLGPVTKRLNKASANTLFGQDYTLGSVFRDSKELAQQILKSFAVTIGRSMLDVAEPNGEDSFARTYAWIVHGPVEYLPETDSALRRIKSLFTKPDVDIYRNQNEYRFWVGFNDTSVQSDKAEILLPVPEEIVTAVELE